MSELTERLKDAETQLERAEDGRRKATNWPKPRVSKPNFLSDLLADWEADQRSRPLT